MRQVMPHRNNIVAQPGRCKSFLRPTGVCPLIWRHCGILIGPANLGINLNNVFRSII
jgi:hypothetical protein